MSGTVPFAYGPGDPRAAGSGQTPARDAYLAASVHIIVCPSHAIIIGIPIPIIFIIDSQRSRSTPCRRSPPA